MLMVASGIALVVVLALSVVLARRDANASANPTQFALSSAVQAAEHVYKANHDRFPLGPSLVVRLHRNDPELAFAYGPQYVVSSNGGSGGQYTATGISVAVSSNGQVIMFAAPGSSRTCWYATDNHLADHLSPGLNGASPHKGTMFATAGSQQVCTAGAALPGNVSVWSATWPST
ncbi:MAG: hypothetical protein WAM97_15075 [Acidimicrobiales bacterium]